jgi:hypothetical protein
LKTSLFPALVASMGEEELLTILFDLAILSKDILGIQHLGTLVYKTKVITLVGPLLSQGFE